ncbi:MULTISPECIES: transmission trait enhancer LetE [unclassified Legionella]|uniref:transmission trait enhancer LetE n=1 Tax=unclassified Legionella TaxID=2622702 RepID=UPI001055868D|nr:MULTISPECIES: transmission trait enhancer LetE [unclassified Legionella]MDI9819188.1 transmission trait enhancer LetE [Legionella sp. PL877]
MKEITALLPDIKLRFNVKHPDLEECYAYGYECALAEINEEANPYHEGTAEHEQWSDGWWAGFYGEKPLFDLAALTIEPEIKEKAVNDEVYHSKSQMMNRKFFNNFLKITGALAATAVVGYQVLDLVA